MAEHGVTGGKFEYVLDAKTREIVTLNGDYTFEDGTGYLIDSEVSYDIDAPEMVKEFLKYVNQTEDLRNITVVSNPGTEKEVSQSYQAAKGLVIGFSYEDEEDVFELYADAACTELYDPYTDTDSDMTIYVKWSK
jgi:predicted small secreted protein